MPLYYHLGPWVWSADMGGHWRAPEGTVGLVDLRPAAAQGAAGGDPQGLGFFASDRPLGSDYALFGTQLDAVLRGEEARRWRSMLSLKPLDGATLLDALWEILTYQSDPEGAAGPLPLDCTLRGEIELHLGGHSLVRSRWLMTSPSNEHWKRLRKMRQNDYKALRRDALEGRRAANLHRKQMTLWCRKYGVDYRELLGGEPDEAPLPPETTITENFNTANGDTLGPNLTWSEVVGDWDIVNYAAEYQDANIAQGAARAQHDLSSSDHYGQASVVAVGSGFEYTGAGAICRFSASAQTYYMSRLQQSNDTLQIYKVVTGTPTGLGSAASVTISLPATVKIRANGSSITQSYKGDDKTTVTDTSISGNTRCGINGYRSDAGHGKPALDDFEAADLAVAVKVPWHLLLRTGV